MYLSHLKLVNFRNFHELELDLFPGVTILYGTNAQGKTSLLEAIYLLAIARSFRVESEREVVNWQAAAAREQSLVGGTICGTQGRLRIYIGYQCISTSTSSRAEAEYGDPSFAVRKQIRVGGVRRTAADLVGLLNAVVFSAEDINLVYGPPSLRRRYLDILISQADAAYLRTLQRYQRVLHQRNQLLKLLQERKAREEELDFWNKELIKEGSWITEQRAQAMKVLSTAACEILKGLTEGLEDLRVKYRPSISLGEEGHGVEERFFAALETSHSKELSLGSTLVGPHRDDFKLLVNGVDMGTYASRGQARTLALTLRLAEASYLTALKGEPIVLLDDVLSELDSLRQKQVLERVLRYEQTIITTTDLHPFTADFPAHAFLYHVKNGEVEKMEDQITERR